jgi:hypothetical protein
MSIDHYYTQIDGNWVNTDMRVVNTDMCAVNKEWEYIPDEEGPDFRTDFWVDICHGGGYVVDERYYFADLASALDFYLEGWQERQYVNRDGKKIGLDHSGLYTDGRLIHGRSIHGDAPGHEGENLRRICEEFARKMDEEDKNSMMAHSGSQENHL